MRGKDGGYVFIFNSQDVLFWPDPLWETFRRYVRHVYPGASDADVLACSRAIRPYWEVPPNPIQLKQRKTQYVGIDKKSVVDKVDKWFSTNRRGLVRAPLKEDYYRLGAEKPTRAPTKGVPKPSESTTGAESEGIMRVENLYDYLFRKFPNHPIFKEDGATLENLIAFLAKEKGGRLLELPSPDKISDSQWKPFLDRSRAGRQAEVTRGGEPGGEPWGIVRFEPLARLSINPPVDKYVAGAKIEARAEFYGDDDNRLFNFFPSRGVFHWKIADAKGSVIDTGPYLGRGENTYEFELSVLPGISANAGENGPRPVSRPVNPGTPAPQTGRAELSKPGKYHVSLTVDSEYFFSHRYSPEPVSIIVTNERDREQEVFDQLLTGRDIASPFERVGGKLRLKPGASALTIEAEISQIDAWIGAIRAMRDRGDISKGQADDYTKIMIERKETLEQTKADHLDGKSPIVAHGTFLDRTSSAFTRLNVVVYGKTERVDAVFEADFQLLDMTLSPDNPPLHTGKAQAEIGADESASRDAAENAALKIVGEHWTANNDYPDGTVHLGVQLSSGRVVEVSFGTHNVKKVVKHYAGYAVLGAGAVALGLSAYTAGGTAPAGVFIIEAGAAYAAAGASLATLGLSLQERIANHTFRADRQTLLDTLQFVATVAGLGGMVKVSAGAKQLSNGFYMAMVGTDVSQAFVLSAVVQREILTIEADYTVQLSKAKTDKERAELARKRDAAIAQAIGAAAISGGFLLVSLGRGVTKVTARGFLRGRMGGPLEFQVRESIEAVGKSGDVDAINTAFNDPLLTVQERAYLQEALAAAAAKGPPTTPSAPAPKGAVRETLKPPQEKAPTAAAPPVAEEKPAPPVAEEKPAPPKAEEKPAPPKAEEKPAPPVAEEKPAPPVAEEKPAPPVAEEKPAPPKAEEKPAPPVAEEKPAPPKAEEKPAPPVAEEKPAPPKAEEKPAPPVAEEKPAPPVAEEKPAPPKAEEKPAPPPKAEEKPAPPKAEEKPAPPKAEEKPAPPVAEEKPAPPKAEEKPAPPVAEEKPAPPKAEEKPAPPPKAEEKPAPPPKAEEKPAPPPKAEEKPAESATTPETQVGEGETAVPPAQPRAIDEIIAEARQRPPDEALIQLQDLRQSREVRIGELGRRIAEVERRIGKLGEERVPTRGRRRDELLGKIEKRQQFSARLEAERSKLASESSKLGREISRLKIILDPKSRVPLPCFSGDTPVWTPGGPRQIASLRAGDVVLSFDFGSGTAIERAVVTVHGNRTLHFYEVAVGGQIIRATGEHPFWVEGGEGWVAASGLRAGMQLRAMGGATVTVRGVTLRESDEADSFNLSVEGTPNYFVGPGVLVHNGEGFPSGLGGPFIVYRGTSKIPKFAGKVYTGSTDDLDREVEHQREARRRLKDPSLEPETREFFEFKSQIELEPLVTGLDVDSRWYLEQKNLEIERGLHGRDAVMNRVNVRTPEEMEVLRKRIAANKKVQELGYCPRT